MVGSLNPSRELTILAQLAEIDPEKLQAVCDEPTKLYEHIGMDDILRLQRACEELARAQQIIASALGSFHAYAQGFLDARARQASEVDTEN